MRVRLSRRQRWILGIVAAAVVAAAIAFGPIARAEVAAEAARRHLVVHVGRVRPAWLGVRLLDVAVRPEGSDSVSSQLDEVRVSVNAGLHVERVEVHGGRVILNGPADRIREDLRHWRGAGGTDAAARGRTPILFDGLSVRWVDGSDTPRLEADGVGGVREESGSRLTAASAHVRVARGDLAGTDVTVQLDAAASLSRAHAGAVTIEWTPPPEAWAGAAAPAENSAPPQPPPLAVRGERDRPRAGLPGPSADAGAPLVRFPDLGGLRAHAGAAAAMLADRLPEGAEVGVDALSWKVSQDSVPLTLGPGPLSVVRAGGRVEVRFSTDPNAASTPIAIRALVPLDQGDLTLTLEGGPVALSLLGVKEGAVGLVDVARATVNGQARVVLGGDGSVLTFDVTGATRGLSIRSARLSPEVVRGIDLTIRARGTMTAAGELRLDDFAATLGAAHVEASGALEQKSDRVSASVRFEVPSTNCQALLESMPTALIPALQGTRVAGTFGARGRFAFDTRSLDDLELDYEIQDQCRVVEVPPALARERFKQPFAHRVYMPDGTTTEQTTGPGAPDWTPLDGISPYMQVAVLTTEDGAFPRHRGFNHAAIRASILANLKARRFVRGASTITMQLAKNLFLSREKTLARKVEEVILTDYLEQAFSKDELMELYLNVVEFGPAVYGVAAAADHYFGRKPAELNLAECMFLASLLPSPIRYGSMREAGQAPEAWMRTLRTFMRIAHKTGLLTEAEVAEGENEAVVFWRGGPRPAPRPPQHMRPVHEAAPDSPEALPWQSVDDSQ